MFCLTSLSPAFLFHGSQALADSCCYTKELFTGTRVKEINIHF